MLAIEADVEAPDKSALFAQYPRVLADHHLVEFITDCLRLMVGGNLDPHELESLLEYELENHHQESAEPAHAIQQVSDSLPGFGIVAAVLGIVNTMGSLAGSDTAAIGEKVAAALVAPSSAFWWPTASSARPPTRCNTARMRRARLSRW